MHNPSTAPAATSGGLLLPWLLTGSHVVGSIWSTGTYPSSLGVANAGTRVKEAFA